VKTSRIGIVLSVCIAFVHAPATWGQATGSQVAIGRAAGQVGSLTIEGKALKLTGNGGGFSSYDATAAERGLSATETVQGLYHCGSQESLRRRSAQWQQLDDSLSAHLARHRDG